MTFLAGSAPCYAQTANVVNPSDLHTAVLNTRAEDHLEGLTLSPELNEAAAAHAQDMAQHQQLAHVFEPGMTPQNRVATVGCFTHVTQNIAAGRNTAALTRALTRGNNRRALSNAELTHVGYGIAMANGVTYVAQILATPGDGCSRTEDPTGTDLPAAPTTSTAPSSAQMQAQAEVQVTPPRTQTPAPAQTGVQVAGSAAAYWICSSNRWWYYPVPANVTGGMQLQADMSVSGPPPGYPNTPCQNGLQLLVPRASATVVQQQVVVQPAYPQGGRVYVQPGYTTPTYVYPAQPQRYDYAPPPVYRGRARRHRVYIGPRW